LEFQITEKNFLQGFHEVIVDLLKKALKALEFWDTGVGIVKLTDTSVIPTRPHKSHKYTVISTMMIMTVIN
jgi:hypothetical protein